jgi:hypothetical protein
MSKELAADYFSRHLSSNECHITSDGRVFHSKGTADSFANGLKNQQVTSYTRADFETPASDEDSGDDSDNDSDEVKVKALDVLKNFDATTAIYPEIKALVKDLGLESPTQKQPDLLATIEAYKVALNTVVNE